MVIFLNPDGTAQKVTPEHVYQGSNNVIDITVIAPYSMSTAMQIGFILPNGLYWTSPPPESVRYAPMEFVGPSEQNDKAGAWHFVLPISVTEQVGEVQVAINAIGTTGNTTSYLCKFTVEESVLPNLPEMSPEPSVYDLIQQYLARLDGRTANVPNLVADIQKASGNSFTYTDNKGVVSAPIAFGMVDYEPTYVGAVSVIELPESAWQPIYNSSGALSGLGITIPAAQHGQMRDGVTAEDLMVNFKRVGSGKTYSQYNATYTISTSGDITVTSTSLAFNPALVAIIWNGKGLADITARNEIEAETAARERADTNLQKQIDEIVDSGVDLTARAAIAAETVARESADADLQADINAEKTRAQSVEQGLQNAVNTNASDIEELREDVDTIDSYIPSSTSASNKLADQAFVNSSINNLAAFYITSNAQGDAFPTRAALLSTATYYYGGQPRVPTQNDYAIVLADESQPLGVDGKYPTTRYSYQGTAWSFQYVVNNTSLTQAQVNAINSGITQALVEQIGENETAIASETAARENADADLQQQIDTLSAGAVYSVNGETGAVTVTPAKIGAVNNAGDTMTGPLTVPKLLGKESTDGRGFIPVRYITRAELGLGVSSADVYLQAWLKKVCQLYPDTQDCIFIGMGNPGSRIMIQAYIYSTSAVNADGMPQYADGFVLQHDSYMRQFNVDNYVYSSTKQFYSASNPPPKTGGLVETVDKTTVITNSFSVGDTITLSNLGFTENQKYVGGMLFIRVGGQASYSAGIIAYVSDKNKAIVTYNGGVSLSSNPRRYQSDLHYYTVG